MRPLLALLLLSAVAAPTHARCTVTLATGPVKVRPYGPPPARIQKPLVCARNEYCSFQVVITAAGEDCRVNDMSVSSFAQGQAKLPDSNITVYRQALLPVFYRSSAQGDLGEWPDALIPKLDPEYAEPRNAFPVDVRRISPAYRKHPASNGRMVPRPRGQGSAVSGGRYTSGLAQRFEIAIVRPGRLGEATFRWRSEPARPTWSGELPISAAPTHLENGVTVAFSGAGSEDDFLPGDEFWIFAGPERRQAVWVDVLIPSDAAAGLYTGYAHVLLASAAPVTLPVEMEVLPFTLPSTTSLPNYFGLYWTGLYAAHYGETQDERRMLELGQAYARAALRNGLTVNGGEEFAPAYEFAPDGTLRRADYSRYDAAVGPLLDGSTTPRGARWTALRLPQFSRYEGSQFVTVVRDFVAHIRQRGWADRLFDYTADEPHTPAQFAGLRARAERVRDAAPETPRLVTTDLSPELFGLVTRWCSLVNHLEPKHTSLRQWKRNLLWPRRADYDARLRAGDSLWWYQSCASHDCSGAGASPEHDNWPSYMVDISAVANRVFGLLTLRYHVGGILYWDTAYAHYYDPGAGVRRVDPWESLYHFGGNGDGSLFYPGRPERIGGTRHIAVESLRLKMIRDSLVDAEYAAMLRKLGEEEFLQRELARVIQNAYHWNADPQAWLDLRERLARRIAARSR